MSGQDRDRGGPQVPPGSWVTRAFKNCRKSVYSRIIYLSKYQWKVRMEQSHSWPVGEGVTLTPCPCSQEAAETAPPKGRQGPLRRSWTWVQARSPAWGSRVAGSRVTSL